MSLAGESINGRELAVKAHLIQAKSIPVYDISQHGVSFRTETPLTIGKQYIILLKNQSRKLLLDGIAVRSSPCKVTGKDRGDRLLYHNGIEFQFDLDDREVDLTVLIQENLFGEKRHSRRSIPDKLVTADIARSCFSDIRSVNPMGMLASGPELLDMDEKWPILLQFGQDCRQVTGRVVSASRKEGEKKFMTKVEFTDINQEAASFLRRISRVAGSETG